MSKRLKDNRQRDERQKFEIIRGKKKKKITADALMRLFGYSVIREIEI